MLIAGLQRISLIDYPKKTSAVIFTGGCNFNCFYCHNREIINKSKIPDWMIVSEKTVFDFLQKRINKLDAVTITGGEPTMQKDLLAFISKIKNLGFLVKLDSNGTNPEMLKILIGKNLVDYIAMDIKAPLEWDKYKKIVGISNKKLFNNIVDSVDIIMNNSVDYEFRTSLVDDMLDVDDIKSIVKRIRNSGIYFLQNFINPEKKEFEEKYKIMYNKLKPVNNDRLKEFVVAAESLGQRCKIRN